MQKPSSKSPGNNVSGANTYVKIQPPLKDNDLKSENKKVSTCSSPSIFEPLLVGSSNQFIPVHNAQNCNQYVQLQLSSDQQSPVIQLRTVQQLQSNCNTNYLKSKLGSMMLVKEQSNVSQATNKTLNNQVMHPLTISSPVKVINSRSKDIFLSPIHNSTSLQSTPLQSISNGMPNDVLNSPVQISRLTKEQNIAPASFSNANQTLLTFANPNFIQSTSNFQYQKEQMVLPQNKIKVKNQAVNHISNCPPVSIKSSKVAFQHQPVFVPITMAGTISMYTNQASQQNGGTLRIHHQIVPRLPTSQSNVVTINPSNHSFLIPVQPQSEKNRQSQFFTQNLAQYQSNVTETKDGSTADTLLRIDSIKPSTNNTIPITDSRLLKKPCNCTKSQCLKLYCECFANGEFCNNCNCRTCFNNVAHDVERSKAIKSCLDRNPYAFHPKIGKGKIKGDTERRHTKGCNCRRSGCLKNYCECYEAKILCSSLCKCSGCKNFEESADRKTLMQLADAAEARVLQQNAAIIKLDTEMKVLNGDSHCIKDKSSISFITEDVSKLTCDILLARAQEAEQLELSEAQIEHSVLEEFSRCLNQIIDKTHGIKKRKR